MKAFDRSRAIGDFGIVRVGDVLRPEEKIVAKPVQNFQGHFTIVLTGGDIVQRSAHESLIGPFRFVDLE